MNPYDEYYNFQAGSGIRGFSGSRYQRGSGWFSRLFSSSILPAFKWLGKKAVDTGLNIADDVLEGKNLKESAKKRALEAGRQTASTAIKRARTFRQTGKGRGRPYTYRCKPIQRNVTKTRNARSKKKTLF